MIVWRNMTTGESEGRWSSSAKSMLTVPPSGRVRISLENLLDCQELLSYNCFRKYSPRLAQVFEDQNVGM